MNVVLALLTSAKLREAPAGASTEHVSMGKAKAKSPPITNFSASMCRLTPMFSVPVIILPIDAQSLDIDNILIIFIMLLNFNSHFWRPPPPPPPPPAAIPPASIVFDAGALASIFQKLDTFLSKFEGSSTPQLEDVGSARRSSTAGPSDKARPNPLTQVSDLAPPGSWCGPLTFQGYEFPPAQGPSHAFADRSGEFPSASEGEDRWEPLRAGRLGDSLPVGLLFKLDSVQARITEHREAITFVLARGMIPPCNHYDDLENTYVVFSLSPVRLLHPVALGILQLLLFLLAQMKLRQLWLPLLHAQVLRHTQRLVIHLSLGLVLRGISDSLPRTVLVHETLLAIALMTVASLKIAHVSDRTSGHGRRFASGDSPDPKRRRSSRASSDDDYFEEPPSRSSPAPPSSPSREDRIPDGPSISAPVQAMVDFILQTFPEYQASPSHPLSRSFYLSTTTGVDEAIPPGSLLSWSHALSHSFSETQERFARRIEDGKACHTLLHTLNKFERVSDSPTQGKELKANPGILDLLRYKVPDSRYVPLSLKDSAALERSMRSMLETHNFLHWSVVALIRSLHDRNLLLKDDQIISQLKKSFSKACGNLASGLSSSAAFVTLKRRQLLLSHVVPSVSDAQTRNLLSDPFFFPNRLPLFQFFCGDCSGLVPIYASLEISSSATPSRRSGYSGSAAPRAPSRPLPAYSSSQRSSSPHRPQPGKKGDSRFRKKSSGPHQKRVSFRR